MTENLTFQDQTAATRMREIIRRIALQEIHRAAPQVRYGTVDSIDLAAQSVGVLFPGETTPVPVKLVGIQPTATGQVVQVSGVNGDHFVSGVVGRASVTDVAEGSLDAPTGVALTAFKQAVIGSWNSVAEAAKYEVQFAEDAGFTTNVRTFETVDTSYTLSGLPDGVDYWMRVRALSASTPPVASGWVSAGPTQAEDFPAGGSDGLAPASSPDAIVTSGIGYLFVEWVPVTNDDLVLYDVHISTTSGFTPSAATKVGEVYGSFFFIRTDASGFALAYDTTYFVRIVARDADGSATPGAQDSGQIDRVETGDAGNIGIDNLSDGVVPPSSPAVDSVHNGVGFLLPRWAHVANDDPVTYEVHVSTSSGFIPDANTYVGETPSNWFFVRTQGAGAAFADLVYGTTYYIKIWAKDADGYAAAAGSQGSGFTVKVNTPDIAVNAITAASGIIADAAIDTAQIADAAIETAKIADLAVSSAKIDNLAVTEAKINNLAVTTAKIGDLAVTEAKIDNLAVTTAKIDDLAVSTAKISALAVTDAKIANLSADKITAGLVSMRRLVASNADNIIPNAGFESGTTLGVGELEHWKTITGGSGAWGLSSTVYRSGLRSAAYTWSGADNANNYVIGPAPNGVNGGFGNGYAPAAEGDKFALSIWTRGSGSSYTGSGIGPWIGFYNRNGTIIGSAGNFALTGVGWAEQTVSATAPAGTAYVLAGARTAADNVSSGTSAFYVDDVYLRRMVDPSIIDYLDAEQITVGTLDADRIGANSLNVQHLAIGDPTNYIRDPGFEETNLAQSVHQTFTNGTGSPGWNVNAVTNGPNNLEYDTSTAYNTSTAYIWPSNHPYDVGPDSPSKALPKVQVGETYSFQVQVRPSGTGGTHGTVSLTIYLYGKDEGASVQSQTATFTVPTDIPAFAWSTIAVEITVVAPDAYYAAPRILVGAASGLNANWLFRGPTFRRSAKTLEINGQAVDPSRLLEPVDVPTEHQTGGSVSTSSSSWSNLENGTLAVPSWAGEISIINIVGAVAGGTSLSTECRLRSNIGGGSVGQVTAWSPGATTAENESLTASYARTVTAPGSSVGIWAQCSGNGTGTAQFALATVDAFGTAHR